MGSTKGATWRFSQSEPEEPRRSSDEIRERPPLPSSSCHSCLPSPLPAQVQWWSLILFQQQQHCGSCCYNSQPFNNNNNNGFNSNFQNQGFNNQNQGFNNQNQGFNNQNQNNRGCQCDYSLTFSDQNGNTHGACQKRDNTGRTWCYTTGWNNNCGDLQSSKRYQNNP